MTEFIPPCPVDSATAPEAKCRWLIALLLVALAASAVVAPMLFLGNASGHDIQFHIASWMDASRQWHEGIVYPRWAEWANWGFGEPRFIFYPPASWMFGAGLGSILPWSVVPGAFIWITLILAGMAMWRLAREWLPWQQAAMAAVFFAVNPYHLAIVYYRSDFAELLGGALLPLLLWAALCVIRGERSHIVVFATLFAAVWLCNAPEAVIATYSMTLVFFVGWVRAKNPRVLLRSGAAMAGGFGLAAFYILPAAYEKRWVQIAQAVADNLRPQSNFIFTHAGNPEFVLFNWKISGVALGMMLVTGIASVFAARKRCELNGIWWALMALGIACVGLMFRPSAFLWRSLPELAFVQFPWRWLEMLAVVFAFFLSVAIDLLRHRWARKLALAVVLATIGISGAMIAHDTWWNSDDAPFIADSISTGHGYEGTDEYAPLGCDRYELPGAIPDDSGEVPATPPTPRIEEIDSASGKIIPANGQHIREEKWTSEDRIFSAESAETFTLAPRLMNYPPWEVRIDGKRVAPASAKSTGQMLIHFPAGAHRVEVLFRRTCDREAGDAISALSAAGLLLFSWVVSREQRSQQEGL